MLKNWDTYLHLHLYLQRKRKETQSDPLGSQKWLESHLICKYVRRELEHIHYALCLVSHKHSYI